jgi:O-antigen/teichoic acid export membrane protein
LGLPLALSNLLDITTTLAERALLSAQVGLAGLGIYSHSQSYLNIAQTGIKPLVRAAWPVSLTEARDVSCPFPRTGQVWSVGHMLLIAAGLLLASFGRDLIGLLTHGKFAAAGPFAALWMGLLLVRLSGRPQLATLFANGRGYAIAKIGIAANVTAIAVLLILVPRVGLAGAVAAAFLQAAVTRALFWLVVRRDRKTPFQDGWVLAGIVMVAAAVALVEGLEPSAGVRALGLAAGLAAVAMAGRQPLGALCLQLKRGWL